MTQRHAVVIGAGVVGLTTAWVLLERGARVRVLSERFSPHTTSNVAAAIWHPFHARPLERVLRWAKASFARYQRLYAEPASGVSERTLTQLHRDAAPWPWWGAAADGVERVPEAELPAGYRSAYRARVPVVEPARFLAFVRERVQALGAELEQRRVSELAAIGGDALLVNCTGLGAAELTADTELYPIRGQIVVSRPCGIDAALVDDGDPGRPTYIIPRSNDCVLGGTVDVGAWSLEAAEAVSADIEARARALAPGIDIVRSEVKVGLRPGRSQVRLELEPSGARPVIHNYGHGGAGFTLAWGCAEEAAQLAEEAWHPRERAQR